MILLIDLNERKGSLAFEEFVRPLESALDGIAECRTAHYLEVDSGLLEGCDRVILCGTPLKEEGYLKRPQAFEWLRGFGKPVLGICAGMQAIAAAYGSRMVKCQEIGMTEVETVKDNPLFKGWFKAYSLHNWAVEPSGEFTVLAKSGNCVEAVKHNDREFYGVLFHPEVRNQDIIQKFAKL